MKTTRKVQVMCAKCGLTFRVVKPAYWWPVSCLKPNCKGDAAPSAWHRANPMGVTIIGAAQEQG